MMSKPVSDAAAPPRAPDAGDAFATAAERLSAARPRRSRQLQEIEGYIERKDLAVATKALTEHLARRPNDPDALFLMARTQLRLGNRREAVVLLGRCLDLEPDFVAARFNFADLCESNKDHQTARAQIERLLESDARNPLFRQLKANILKSLGETEKALLLFEELALENPARQDCWLAYGHALRTVGAAKESLAAYRKVIALNPSCGAAYWSLANMKTARFSDAELETLQQQLRRTNLSDDDRVQMHYSLGKAYEDRGAYEQSFEHYAKGNAAMRLRIPYDADALTRQVKRNKAVFTPSFLRARMGAGSPARDPIFVISLPRSGSTLIEQILSSHSQVEGVGELPYIGAIGRRFDSNDYPKGLADLADATLAQLGEKYLSLVKSHRNRARPHFVDKNPPNWFHIGLIHLILPNARIVDVRRHPGACCFSQFRQYFAKVRPRQAELGRLYRDYVELMAHFDRVLPGKIHRVSYEELVANPEAEIRRLLDYLELPFEQSCLRFYETKRSVLTPSSEQVRKPISADAVDQWRNYEPWLGPLLNSLGSALTAYPAVPEDLR